MPEDRSGAGHCDPAADDVVVLDRTGRIRYVAPSIARLLDRPPGTLVGKRGLDLVHPDDRAAARGAFRGGGSGAEGGGGAVLLRALKRRAGWTTVEVRPAELHTDRPAGGVRLSCRATGGDEPDGRTLRMRALAAMSARVAHEFNNVFTVINGDLWRLEDAIPADGPASRELAALRTSIDRAGGLSQKLLAYTRQQVLVPRAVDLSALLAGIAAAARAAASPGIDVVHVPTPDAISAWVDAAQIEEAVLNLVSNAFDAMPAGGVLTLHADVDHLGPELAATFSYEVRPGRYARLTVSDSGVGMPPELVADAFEPFFTTHANSARVGLGLPVAYGVVKQSGGYLWVDSTPGIGTTAVVYLPLTESPKPAPSAVLPQIRDRGPAMILVVEDDAAVRGMVVKVLLRNGYGVMQAGDGDEALQVAGTESDRIDLVISDVMMPGMSGRELVRRLRTIRADVLVLFMSGYAREATMQPELFDEGDRFLQKPFTPAALLKCVEDMLWPVGGRHG